MTWPIVPESFEWVHSSCGLALKCRPLDRLAPHLFTTRGLRLSAQDDWHCVARAVGADKIVTAHQVHGREVVAIRRGMPLPEERPTCDVLVSNDPATAVAVRAADCVPLLFADDRSGAVAAVHAGWRGVAAGAIPAAVEALVREFGTEAAHIHVAIGPNIGPCCYEVGTELVDAFAAAGHPRYLVDRWFQAVPPPVGTFPAALAGEERSRLRLDLALASRDQLALAGVDQDHIHVAGLCTAMHLDVLTSYRAEKDQAGRLAGVIRARDSKPSVGRAIFRSVITAATFITATIPDPTLRKGVE
jgi:polyphenol oxidase